MARELAGSLKRIGVLIESHFDELEYRAFNHFFPENGCELVYISRLWGQEKLVFEGLNLVEEVVVSHDVDHVDLDDLHGLILIGAYAMDRLRYDPCPRLGQPNQTPAIAFLRRAVAAMDADRLSIGTICHSLWLFTAAPELLQNRKVTCAHNILCDVQNAGAQIVYGEMGTCELYQDGKLITAKHPDVLVDFMDLFLRSLNA